MNLKKLSIVIATMVALVSPNSNWLQAQTDPDIDFHGSVARTIPISVSGYSGVIQDVLRFDLEVAGFELATPDRASFFIVASVKYSRLRARPSCNDVHGFQPR